MHLVFTETTISVEVIFFSCKLFLIGLDPSSLCVCLLLVTVEYNTVSCMSAGPPVCGFP